MMNLLLIGFIAGFVLGILFINLLLHISLNEGKNLDQ